MKPLTCEMCGSNDVLKQDGLFICQICGTKYSVEEAKKMMIEGTVDVSGSTVRIDNSASAQNYLMMAESAYSAKNNAEAEMYCNKVIEIEPKNHSAWFLKGKAAGWQSSLAKLRVEESVQCFSKAIDYAPSDKVESYKQQASDEINNLSVALVTMCCNSFVNHPSSVSANSIANATMNTQKFALQLIQKCGVGPAGFNGKIAALIDGAVNRAWPGIKQKYTGSDGHPTKYAFETFKTECFDCINLLKIAIAIDKESQTNNIQRYKNLIAITNEVVHACSWKKQYNSGGYIWVREFQLTKDAKQKNIDSIMEYHNKIHEIDPNYKIPRRPSAGGCYVATCVYGSYDCPEVWTLRRYRDDELASTWYGRAFIHTYYTVSPTIVKLLGNRRWFKNFWKKKLDIMVDRLHSKGFDNTPYEDKDW